MKRLLSFRIAFVLSALVLLAGWQASVPGQQAAPDYGDDFVGPGYGSSMESFAPLNPAWETDYSKLQTVLTTKPQSLNPQQLRILDGRLESKTESLTKQYADATDEAQRKKLESELAEVVGQHFVVRQAIRDREIAKIEQEVARLRELLEQRENARQQIVQGRLDQLIRSAKGLGWDGNGATAAVPGGAASPLLRRPAAPTEPAWAPFEADATPPGIPPGPRR